MDNEYSITSVDKPGDDAWEVIGGGINQFNNQQAGESRGKLLCFVLRGPDQLIAGGVIGETHWEWCSISLMFVREDLRGRGFGSRLLDLAEEEARKRGAKMVYLDTFSFQAPEFYKKHGYEVFGVLEDFPAGHQRYYLKKRL